MKDKGQDVLAQTTEQMSAEKIVKDRFPEAVVVQLRDDFYQLQGVPGLSAVAVTELDAWEAAVLCARTGAASAPKYSGMRGVTESLPLLTEVGSD